MLGRATERDRERLLDYLRREPEYNLFIIGDILNFGFDSDVVEFFLAERSGDVEAVVMRYRDSFIPYTHDASVDLGGLAGTIDTFINRGGRWMIQGKTDVIGRVRELVSRPPVRERDLFFCRCRRLHAEVPLDQLSRVRIATPDDARDVGGLLTSTPEFNRTDYAHLRGEIEERKTTISLIRDPQSGRVVSTAAWVSESDGAAMIIGVATLPSERGKGYASACVARLVEELANEGKSACLFFDNPAAGRIYRRLGFEDIGMWKALHFES